jgi:fructokinase
MVSLSRLGIPVRFISEVGKDKVGRLVLDFMQANGMDTQYIAQYDEGKSAISLAFLNQTCDAEYMFFTEYPEKRLDVIFPKINADDIVVFGSFYALDPELRYAVTQLLEYAHGRKAIIYYDINFRKSHAHKALHARPTVMDNLEFADLVRGSDEDFLYLYGKTDMKAVYRDEVEYYCRKLLTTHGADGVNLFTEKSQTHFAVEPVIPLSTVGAGDTFNAGVIYGLIRENIGRDALQNLDRDTWGKIIGYAAAFAAHVCQSYDNYLSEEFAARYKLN